MPKSSFQRNIDNGSVLVGFANRLLVEGVRSGYQAYNRTVNNFVADVANFFNWCVSCFSKNTDTQSAVPPSSHTSTYGSLVGGNDKPLGSPGTMTFTTMTGEKIVRPIEIVNVNYETPLSAEGTNKNTVIPEDTSINNNSPLAP